MFSSQLLHNKFLRLGVGDWKGKAGILTVRIRDNPYVAQDYQDTTSGVYVA